MRGEVIAEPHKTKERPELPNSSAAFMGARSLRVTTGSVYQHTAVRSSALCNIQHIVKIQGYLEFRVEST